MKKYRWLALIPVLALCLLIGTTGCEDDDDDDGDKIIVVTNAASASTQQLAPPVLLAPADSTTGFSGDSVYFDWSDVDGAEQYELHVDAKVQVVIGSEANYQLIGHQVIHTWWVTAVSSTRGKSPASEVRKYTTFFKP